MDKNKFLVVSICSLVFLSVFLPLSMVYAENTKSDENIEGSWHTVATFRGTDDRTTSPFHIKGEYTPWRITYYVTTGSEYPFFDIELYKLKADGTREWINSWSTDRSINRLSAEPTYVYSGEGYYYLDITTANISSYQIIVEEYY